MAKYSTKSIDALLEYADGAPLHDLANYIVKSRQVLSQLRVFARDDLLVKYSDVRASLSLILQAESDPRVILSSLDDAISNNLGD